METRAGISSAVGIIYLITCTANGKVYVGQTRQSLQERWQGHLDFSRRPSASTYLANAIRKYGRDAFSIEVLCESPVEELNAKEIEYIALYSANDRLKGYNMSLGGDGGQNSISPEVRLKISRTKKGVSHGPCKEETKQKISAANKGRCRTEEQRLRIKQSREYGPLTDEHRKAISAGLKKTAKYKLSEAQRAAVVAKLETHSDAQLAAQYEVSRKMIWRIRREFD